MLSLFPAALCSVYNRPVESRTKSEPRVSTTSALLSGGIDLLYIVILTLHCELALHCGLYILCYLCWLNYCYSDFGWHLLK